MASNKKVEILLTAKDQASAAIKGVGSSLEGLQQKSNGLIAGFGGLAKTGAIAASVGIVAAGTAAIKSASDFEMLRTNIITLTGSVEKGGAKMKELADFAAKTPFETRDLVEATQTMMGFGISAEESSENLRMLGDVSLGNKNKLQGLTLAFSQIQSTGRLMGQDLLQMINNGFNPLTIISQKTGKSMAVLKKEMENGAISADQVTDAFKIATSEGGLFYKGMDQGSKTLSGSFSTLKDEAFETLRSIVGMSETGEIKKGGVFYYLKEAVVSLTDAIKNLQPTMTQIGNLLNTYVGPAFNLLWNNVQKLIPKLQELWVKISPVLIPVLQFLGYVIGGIVVGAIYAAVYAAGIMVGAVSKMIGAFNWIIGKAQQVGAQFWGLYHNISGAMSSAAGAIIGPLARAFSWIIQQAARVSAALSNLNPFQRHSPSLIDNIKAGAKIIKSEYADVFSTVGALSRGNSVSNISNNNSNVNVTITGGINNTGGMTPDEISKTLSRQLELARSGAF